MESGEKQWNANERTVPLNVKTRRTERSLVALTIFVRGKFALTNWDNLYPPKNIPTPLFKRLSSKYYTFSYCLSARKGDEEDVASLHPPMLPTADAVFIQRRRRSLTTERHGTEYAEIGPVFTATPNWNADWNFLLPSLALKTCFICKNKNLFCPFNP